MNQMIDQKVQQFEFEKILIESKLNTKFYNEGETEESLKKVLVFINEFIKNAKGNSGEKK